MRSDRSRGWDALHAQARYRPAYPSEPVVRFVASRLGGVTAAAPDARTVLDLGCGAGRHSALIARSGHKTVSADRSLDGLRHTRETLDASGSRLLGVAADIASLPFDSDRFDAVVAYGVINYATRAGMRQAVEEVWRVLRPGGWAHVVTRTDSDHRAGKGEEIEPGTFVLDIEETSEPGMLMRFIDRREIDVLFGHFAEVIVDRIDHTSGGGAIANSDWVIEARR